MAELPTDGGPTPWWAAAGIDPAYAAAMGTAAVAPTPDLTVPPVAPTAAPIAPPPAGSAPEPELSFTPDDLSQSVSTARPIDPPPPLVAGASPVLAALPPADFAAVQTRLGQKQQDAAGDERQRSLDADQAKIADYERITREGNANYLKGLADNNTARDAVLKHGIDRGHLWSTRTGAQKAEMTVAGVLGGMFSSYNDGRNGAIEAYQKAVDQDIEAQKATMQANLEGLSQNQTALGQAFAATGDMAKAELIVKDEQWKTLDQRLAEAQAKVTPDGRKMVELEVTRRQAAAQQAQTHMALEKHTADVAKTTAEATKAQAEALAKPREVQIEAGKAAETVRRDRAEEGNVRLAATRVAADKSDTLAREQEKDLRVRAVKGLDNRPLTTPGVDGKAAPVLAVNETAAKELADSAAATSSYLGKSHELRALLSDDPGLMQKVLGRVFKGTDREQKMRSIAESMIDNQLEAAGFKRKSGEDIDSAGKQIGGVTVDSIINAPAAGLLQNEENMLRNHNAKLKQLSNYAGGDLSAGSGLSSSDFGDPLHTPGAPALDARESQTNTVGAPAPGWMDFQPGGND